MDVKELHDLLHDMCESAYEEGRNHQFDQDCPDVGPHFPKTFKDTIIFKLLERNYKS
jgi:hypothetical protein